MIKQIQSFWAVVLCTFSAFAQDVDTTMWSTNGKVTAIVRSGQTVYLGGSFTGIGPVTGSGATLHTGTGRLVRVPPAKITGLVRSSVPDGKGGWYVGGSITGVGARVRTGLAHILPDGSLDADWNAVITGTEVTVNALALVHNTLYVGGSFSTVGGQNRNNLVALDAATGQITPWNPNAGASVNALALAGNTIYVAGHFTVVGGQVRKHLAAVDAATGAVRAWNPSPDYAVSNVVVWQSTVYVTGFFTNIGGQARSRLAAVDAVTGLATAWNPQPSHAYPMVLSGSTLYVGGYFSAIAGQHRAGLAAFDLTTGQLTPWNPYPNGNVHTMAAAGGVVYLGGSFTTVNYQRKNYLAAVDAVTGRVTDWDSGANDQVGTLSVAGSTLFAGGLFSAVGMQHRSGLAALNANTGEATAWNPAPDNIGITSATILALAVAGGNVYVSGQFNHIGGQARRALAAVDTITGAATAWSPGPVDEVHTMAAYGNALYLGGSFRQIGGQARSGLAALDLTTGQLTDWAPRATDYSTVGTVAVWQGKVYVAGNFLHINDQPRRFVAAIDAATGEVIPWNPAHLAGGGVKALAFFGNTVFVAGVIYTNEPKAGYGVIALDATTGEISDWTTRVKVGGPVLALAAHGNLLHLGGRLNTVGSLSLNGAAAVDVVSAGPAPWRPAPDNEVDVITAYEGAIYVAGPFTNVQGKERSYFAAFRPRVSRTSLVRGAVYEDTNGDCVRNAGEKGIAGRIIVAQPGNYFASTDTAGNYALRVDTGSYTVGQVLPADRVAFTRSVCPVNPPTYPVRFARHDSTVAGKDFASQTLFRPHLTVGVSSGRRRRCFRNNTVITYCNGGTDSARNVQVRLQLPEHVVLIQAGLSYTKDQAHNYVFNIGSLAAGTCGTIQLADSVVCNNPDIRGLTQCTKVWITPANDQTPDPEWDRSDVTLKARCGNNGRVRLALHNSGTGSMADSSAYRVYLDAQLAFARNYKLAQGDSLVLHVPANGRTVRLEADQRPAHPDKRQRNITLEACGTNNGGTVSKGYVCQFPQDDEEPEVAIECLPIIDSFDPNDKAVSPEGVTAQRYTPTGRALDYVVRFQNTGTDVAYQVVVVDTLSEHLDISTLRVGAVSHPYKISVSGKGGPVLTFTFNGIMLPDSAADEPRSHGHIQFSIRPKASLPEKTRVENFADIFFDYNEPVRTNTTLNTIYDVPPVVAADVALAPGDVCPIGNAAVSAGANRTLCAQDTVQLSAGSPPEGNGRWKLVQGAGTIAEGNRPDAIVTGLAYGENVFQWRIPAGGCGVDSLAARVTITRLEKPVPVISQSGSDGLVCSVAGSRYEWFRDGVKLGQQGRQIRVSQPGRYTVRVEMPGGCQPDPSEAYAYGVTGLGPGTSAAVRIFPNPTPGRLVIALPVSVSGPVDVRVVDKIGRTVLAQTCNPAGGADGFRVELDLSAQATGLYVIKLQTGNSLIVRSVFKK